MIKYKNIYKNYVTNLYCTIETVQLSYSKKTKRHVEYLANDKENFFKEILYIPSNIFIMLDSIESVKPQFRMILAIICRNVIIHFSTADRISLHDANINSTPLKFNDKKHKNKIE